MLILSEALLASLASGGHRTHDLDQTAIVLCYFVWHPTPIDSGPNLQQFLFSLQCIERLHAPDIYEVCSLIMVKHYRRRFGNEIHTILGQPRLFLLATLLYALD